MKRIQFPVISTLICSAMVGCATDGDKPKKDVLFIVVDDLADALGCYGNDFVQTPNIDKLASKGMLFNDAHCNHPVSGASRASFLTGLKPETTGILQNDIKLEKVVEKRVTLPYLFKLNGYETVGLGKVFHAPWDATHGDPKAWDEQEEFHTTMRGKEGETRNTTDGALPWFNWKMTEGGDIDQKDGQIAQRAIELINTERDKPLFLALGFMKPHSPFWAPKKYFDMYALEDCDPHILPDDYVAPVPSTFPQDYMVHVEKFDDQDKRELLRAYYACISFIDAQLGKVIDALEKSGKMDDTVIIFFSDHGYHLGEHNFFGKSTLFDINTRAPFILAGASTPHRGVTTDATVQYIDIYPTIAELANLDKVPTDLEGRSFVSVLENPETHFRDEICVSSYRRVENAEGHIGWMVRDDRWLYIEWGESAEFGTALYDVTKDPNQYYNIIDKAENKEVAIRMKALLNTLNKPTIEL